MKIANKKVSAERLVRDALEKAKHFSDYNIFTFLNEEGALKKAREIDKKNKARRRSWAPSRSSVCA